MHRKLWLLALPVLIILMLSAGCDNDSKKNAPIKVQYVNIATATTGGAYYPLGNALAQLFNQNIAGIKASAIATAGTPQNVLLMQKKDAEVAFAQNGVAHYAFIGEDMFRDKPAKFLRGITNLYPNVVHIIVAANSNIKSVKDFEGRKFAPGAIGSATEINSKEILSLYGLDYKDKQNVKGEYLGYPEAVEALRVGRVDGILIAGGIPTAAVSDAASSPKIRLLSLEPEMIAKLKRTMPWYYEITIPQGTYMGQMEDVHTVAVANLLICREDLNDDLVYNMTKILYEKQNDLIAAHPAVAQMKLMDAMKGMTVPLHPGAEKYYKEQVTSQ